jgi:hypothetical protein
MRSVIGPRRSCGEHQRAGAGVMFSVKSLQLRHGLVDEIRLFASLKNWRNLGKWKVPTSAIESFDHQLPIRAAISLNFITYNRELSNLSDNL